MTGKSWFMALDGGGTPESQGFSNPMLGCTQTCQAPQLIPMAAREHHRCRRRGRTGGRRKRKEDEGAV